MVRQFLGYTPAALVSLMASVVLWAVSFPMLRLGLLHFPPVTLGFLRYGMAALLGLAYLQAKFGLRRSIRELAPDFPLFLGLGAFGVAVPNITQNMGLWRNESSSLTAIIQASGPAFALILAFLILGEAVGWRKVLGIILAILATSLLVSEDLTFRGTTFVGNLLVLASAASYGVAGIFAKTLLSRRNPGMVVSWSFILGTLLTIPALPLDWGLPIRLEAEGLAILLFLAFLPGLLATFLFYVVLKGQDLSRLVFFLYFIPLIAGVTSVLFLGEVVSTRMALLGLLVIVGVAISQYEASSDPDRRPRG